jgi:WD40 repeat protein
MNFFESAPFLGTWFRCRYVRRIVRDAHGGDCTAVTELCNFVCDSGDAHARDIATLGLAGLRNPESIRVFFEEVLVRNDPVLNLIAQGQLMGLEDKGKQALIFFVTGEKERYHAFDPAPHPFLARGYAESGRRVKAAVCRATKGGALNSVFVRILHGNAISQDPPHLSPEEWEVLITGLIEMKRWEELEALVFSAPISLAVTALHALRGSGWEPVGNDHSIWEMVNRGLPDIWSHPLPGSGSLTTIRPGDGLVTRHAFSHDGTLLALGNCDGSVQVWHVRTGAHTSIIPTGNAAVTFIVFSVDNRFLICGEDPATFRCRHSGSGRIQWEYRVRNGNGACLPVISPDKSFLVISETEDRLVVLSTGDGTPVRILSGFPSPVTALAVLPDCSAVYAGCADGSICAATLVEGLVTILLKGRGDPVRTLGVSADGERVTAIFDTSPPVLVGRDGNVLRRFTGHAGRVTVAAITPDGSCFVIAGAGRTLNIWRHCDSSPVLSLPVSAKRVTACALTPDGRSLAIGYNSGTVKLIRVSGDGPEWEHHRHRKGVTSLALSPDGTLIFSTGWDRSVRLWDAKTGELERTLMRESGGVTGVALLDNGNIIAAGYSGGEVALYRRDTGESIRSLNRYTQTAKAMASDHPGTHLAYAGGDNSLLCWNMADDSVTSCEGLRGPPRCLSFIPGEDILISGGWDGKVRLWDMPKGTLLATLSGHTSIITSCAASPDGMILATGSNDRTVRIWSCRTRRGIRVIRDSRTEVGAMTFSPDGCYLVAAGSDERIRVYTMPDGTQDLDIPGIIGAVTALAFTEDGQILAAGYDTGILVLISWMERRIIHTIHAHSGPVTGIVILPGGEDVVTGSRDGYLRVWRLPLAPALAGKTMDDLARVSRLESVSPPGKDREQWRFLRTILSARFSFEIELCPDQMETGAFDIQIAG